MLLLLRCMSSLLVRTGPPAMSDCVRFREQKRKLNFGAVRSVCDP